MTYIIIAVILIVVLCKYRAAAKLFYENYPEADNSKNLQHLVDSEPQMFSFDIVENPVYRITRSSEDQICDMISNPDDWHK